MSRRTCSIVCVLRVRLRKIRGIVTALNANCQTTRRRRRPCKHRLNETGTLRALLRLPEANVGLSNASRFARRTCEPAEFEAEAPKLLRRLIEALNASGLSYAAIADSMATKESSCELLRRAAPTQSRARSTCPHGFATRTSVVDRRGGGEYGD
jgi:hypothetical protein